MSHNAEQPRKSNGQFGHVHRPAGQPPEFPHYQAAPESIIFTRKRFDNADDHYDHFMNHTLVSNQLMSNVDVAYREYRYYEALAYANNNLGHSEKTKWELRQEAEKMYPMRIPLQNVEMVVRVGAMWRFSSGLAKDEFEKLQKMEVPLVKNNGEVQKSTVKDVFARYRINEWIYPAFTESDFVVSRAVMRVWDAHERDHGLDVDHFGQLADFI